MTKQILVIEDDDEMREVYDIVLSVQGYEVRSATNGLDGIYAVRDERPDLIVLDIAMPRVSGWSVLRMLREADELSDIPVIVVTGHSEPANVARGWDLGAVAYLPKPVAVDDLVLLVDRLVSGVETPQPVAQA